MPLKSYEIELSKYLYTRIDLNLLPCRWNLETSAERVFMSQACLVRIDREESAKGHNKYCSLISPNTNMTSQHDFGSLGIPDETEHEVLLHVADHPVLSRRNSEKSMEDLELRSHSRESSCTESMDDLNELFIILSENTPTSKKCVVQSSKAGDSKSEPVRRATAAEPCPPPRRFPRRFWIGLVKRMLLRQRVSTTGSSDFVCCDHKLNLELLSK